jgi:hypothetical protein
VVRHECASVSLRLRARRRIQDGGSRKELK